MVRKHILLDIAILLLVQINPTWCLSGCDDVDISFLIDIDSIINTLSAFVIWY